jgi:hypothetical protein
MEREMERERERENGERERDLTDTEGKRQSGRVGGTKGEGGRCLIVTISLL